MPDLNEQSLMDMPTTVPRASIAEAEKDLRVRDEVLRGFPEVWQVVGKAGRAETPTDSAPLDMIETVINLRDHAVWPKRKLRFEDAVAQTGVALDTLESKGLLRRPASAQEREGLISEAVMTVANRVDEILRDLAVVRDRSDLLTPRPAFLERAAGATGDVLGFAKSTLFTRIAAHLDADYTHRLKERIKSLNWELFDRSVGAANWAALEELSKL